VSMRMRTRMNKMRICCSVGCKAKLVKDSSDLPIKIEVSFGHQINIKVDKSRT